MFHRRQLITALLTIMTLSMAVLNPAQADSTPYCQQQLDVKTCAKIGQMLVIGFGGMKLDAAGNVLWDDPHNLEFAEDSVLATNIRDLHVGGVILFTQPVRDDINKEYLRERNIQNPQQVTKLNHAISAYSQKIRQQQGLATLPILITIDQEGGITNRLPTYSGFQQATVTPQALGYHEELAGADTQARQQAIQATYQYAKTMGKQLNQLGFNVNFAPVVDVNINPLNPIIGGLSRSFSRDPQIVADQAQAFHQAFTETGILTTLKHFPGHGSSQKDSHLGLVNVSDNYQKTAELYPYHHLIQNGYSDLIMSAHVINGQIDKTPCQQGNSNNPHTWCPMTLSHKALTELLRHKLNFQGVVISDDMTMGAIAQEYPLEVALEKAINAGVDMFIFANHTQDQTEQVVHIITDLIVAGKVSQARIDEAYERIVALKSRLSTADE